MTDFRVNGHMYYKLYIYYIDMYVYQTWVQLQL